MDDFPWSNLLLAVPLACADLVAFGIFGAGLTLVAVPAVAVALVAAVLSYYLIELPFLRRRRRPSDHRKRLGVECADLSREPLAETGR